jgi:hypothetical protein
VYTQNFSTKFTAPSPNDAFKPFSCKDDIS